MKWSSRIVRIGGADIYIHWSFALVMIYLGLCWATRDGQQALFASMIVVLLIGSVMLHELGHTVVARWLSIEPRRIVLSPLGGFAILSREPGRPLHELSIAAAGPLANLIIAGGAALAAAATGVTPRLDPVLSPSAAAAPQLFGLLVGSNLGMALLNLLPIYPLDGGRIVRASLSLMLGQTRATQLMLRLSLASALALAAFILLLLQPGAGFVGAFVAAATASTTRQLMIRRRRTPLQTSPRRGEGLGEG